MRELRKEFDAAEDAKELETRQPYVETTRDSA
jgi:hypothetical protein